MVARSTYRAIFGLTVVVTLALLIVGCGDDDGSATDSATTEAPSGETAVAGERSPFDRDACELLAPTEVSDVLGTKVQGKFTKGDASSSTPGQCTWSSGEPVDLAAPEPTPTGITLLLGDRQIFDNTRVLAENGDDYEALDGVGDEAYVGDGQGGVLIGDAGITITPIGVNVNDPAVHELIADLLTMAAANY